jgi:hypothetical protein
MPEEAVAEPVAAEAQPVPAEAPPAESEQVAPAEEQPEAPKFDLGVLKGLKADEARVVLSEMDEAEREAVIAEWRDQGEQRAKTADGQMKAAVDARHNLWQQTTDLGKQAEAYLRNQVQRAQAGDLEALSDHRTVQSAIDVYRNAAVAQLALENENLMKPVRDKYLPDATPEEAKALEKVLWQDATKGTQQQIPVVIDLAIARARAEGEAAGLAKGQKLLNASESLVKRLEAVTEVKKKAAGVQPNGTTAPAPRAAVMEALNAIDPRDPEAQKKLNELRPRLKAL